MSNMIRDISIEEYHASEGVSRSGLMKLRKSRFHYWYEFISGKAEKEDTDAMVFGSALHTYILEPQLFKDKYFIAKKVDRRTTVGKELYAKMLLEAGDRIVINEDNYTKLQDMAEAISYSEQATKLLQGGQVEKSIYWTDEETGLVCKCRPDLWRENAIVDLKTTTSASYKDFQNSCYKFGYHIQAAMMQEGIKHATGKTIDSFIFVAIEKDAPYATAVYLLDEQAIIQGRKEFKVLLNKLKESQETNDWHTYDTEVLTLPAWAHNEVLA